MTHDQKRRHSLLARVHILRNELGLNDDEYRYLIHSVTGKSSAADLDAIGLNAWLKHLLSLKKLHKKPKQHQYKLTPVEKKIWSLWQQLADEGKVKNRKMAALIAYVKTHVARVDHLSWLNGAQQDALIEQLKKWLERS